MKQNERDWKHVSDDIDAMDKRIETYFNVDTDQFRGHYNTFVEEFDAEV